MSCHSTMYQNVTRIRHNPSEEYFGKTERCPLARGVSYGRDSVASYLGAVAGIRCDFPSRFYRTESDWRPNDLLGIESLGMRRALPHFSVLLGIESLGILRSAPHFTVLLGIESLGIRRSLPHDSVLLDIESLGVRRSLPQFCLRLGSGSRRSEKPSPKRNAF